MRVAFNAFGWAAGSLAVMILAGPPPNALAPTAGHVVFPQGYQENYQVLCRFDKTGKKELVTVYGNDPAASVSTTSQLPYPYGSVIVMETSSAASDSDGKVVLDETGHYRKDKVLGLHVMGKERGFGEGYGQDRTGEWDYVEYRPDGSYITPPEKSQVCAQCHLKAGRDKDFVYGERFHSDSSK
jgi:Cytochrome P460